MRAQLAGVAIGIWLMVAPAVLNYAGAAATIDRIIGPIVVAVSWIAASECMRSVRWLKAPCGLTLLIAPMLLEYATSSTVNSIVCGLVVTWLSTIRGPLRARMGGGWRALARSDVEGRDVRPTDPA